MNSQGTSPSFASSSQGWREISLYIFMCMLSMWIRFRFYIFACVYVYIFFLNSRSLAGPLLNFFVNTGFWGWTQVNFLTRRYLSARIFRQTFLGVSSCQHSGVLVCYGLFSQSLRVLIVLFWAGSFVFFFAFQFPRMLPHSPPTLRLTMLCIHLEICIFVYFLYVCTYVLYIGICR